MPLSDNCDREISPGRYCDKPATWIALSSNAPDMWDDHDNGNASLASFCSYVHALAEHRPSLAAAKRMHATIAEMTSETTVLSAWERALAAYPKPIPVVDRNCCRRHWGDPFNAEPCAE